MASAKSKSNAGPKEPAWYERCESRGVSFDEYSKRKKSIILISAYSKVTIKNEKDHGYYTVECIKIGSTSHAFKYVIKVWMEEDELKLAFNLSDTAQPRRFTATRLKEKYFKDVTAAVEGKFMRYKNIISIPYPNNGYADDPNFAFKIDKEMQQMVRKLISDCKRE